MLLQQTVRVAQPGERHRVVDTITSAFESDPAARWMYPDQKHYRRFFPALIDALGGRAIEHGAAYIAEGFSGAAMWLPPGISPDEAALMDLVDSTVDASLKEAAFTMFEHMGHYHPHEPHWYLPLIGVTPSHQGAGVGGLLLEYALARCDRDRLPAYLEATSRRSVPLYRRYGFEPIAVIDAGAGAPPIVPMVRQPISSR